MNRTCIVFAGSGCAHKGIGLRLYGLNHHIDDLWNGIEVKLKNKFGFSLREIIEQNPIRISIEGNIYSHPDGVLFLSPFQQISILLYEISMIYKHFPSAEDRKQISYSTGHSLGEAVSILFQVPSICPIHFLYSLFCIAMEIELYFKNDSNKYGMTSVNPSYASMSEEDLINTIEYLSHSHPECWLEISNYNITNRQYIVTGTFSSLEYLRIYLDEKRLDPLLFNSIPSVLEEGQCSYPLPIYIPTHSTRMKPFVPRYRRAFEILFQSLTKDDLRYIHRHITHIIPEPFMGSSDFSSRLFSLFPETKEINITNLSWEEQCKHCLIEICSRQCSMSIDWISISKYIEKQATHILELSPKKILCKLIPSNFLKKELVT